MGWLIAFAVVMIYITVFGFMYSAKQADRLSEKHYKGLKGASMTIYLSGPVTDTPDYFERFAAKEAEMRKAYPEACIINPVVSCQLFAAKVLGFDKLSLREQWILLMGHCRKELKKCTHIYMMDNWNKSRGACVEYFLAQEYGLDFC